jgi:hypothetical protein
MSAGVVHYLVVRLPPRQCTVHAGARQRFVDRTAIRAVSDDDRP